MGDELESLLKELAEHADAAIKATAVADAHLQAIRERLPEARKQGAGPAQLARTIRHLYAAGTISRWTAAIASDRKGPGRRKAPAHPS